MSRNLIHEEVICEAVVAPHTRRVSRNFLVHGDGGAEEDEEGGSQKGEA